MVLQNSLQGHASLVGIFTKIEDHGVAALGWCPLTEGPQKANGILDCHRWILSF